MYQLKTFLKNTIYKLLSWEPLLNKIRERKLTNKVVVLMYHEIAEDDADIEAWTVVRKSEFLKQMEYLSKHFNIVSLGQALQLIMNPRSIQKPTVVITFDDGYAGNNRVLLPIVRTMGIPVTIFIATRAIQERTLYWYDALINALQTEKLITVDLRQHSLHSYRINECKGPQNWNEIERLLSDLKTLNPSKRATIVKNVIEGINANQKKNTHILSPLTMSDLHELANCKHITIGAHSHCHNILTQLQNDDIKKSIQTSKELLESWFSSPIKYFSYPNGNFNDIA